MTKFSNKLKKPCFWHVGPLSQFWGKKKQLHMSFYHHATFQKKLMIQFQENASREEREDGRMERRTDPIL